MNEGLRDRALAFLLVILLFVLVFREGSVRERVSLVGISTDT